MKDPRTYRTYQTYQYYNHNHRYHYSAFGRRKQNEFHAWQRSWSCRAEVLT